MAGVCDICGYESKSSVVHMCPDGIRRCKLCRQRATVGRVLGDRDVRFMSPRQIEEMNNDDDIYFLSDRELLLTDEEMLSYE